jgi:hypothetical protein
MTNVLSKIHPLFILHADFSVKKYSLTEGGRIIFAVLVLVLVLI